MMSPLAVQACCPSVKGGKIMQKVNAEFLSNIIPIPPETHHGYSLRSGSVVNSSVKVVARTERMNNFCSYKYQ